MEITENTIWKTMHGKKVKLKDVDDTHLVNLLHYAKRPWHTELRKVLEGIAKKRKLSKAQLERQRIPYKHNGKWQYWNELEGTTNFCSISDGELSIAEDELIEQVKSRLLGEEPGKIYYICKDCKTPYQAINGKIMCNGIEITVCPWCRKDSKPNKYGRGA